MYQLNIANKNYSSWSLRPWVLMRTLAIPFEERLTPFVAGTTWEAFRRFAPNGKVPCLVDDGTAIWDSLAIVEYLAERHDGVWPADSKARAFARCAAAEMHSGFGALRSSCGMTCGLRVRLHEVPDALRSDLARLDELWNDGLARFGGPFLAGGAFTAVDAFFAPVAFRVQTYGLTFGTNATAYVTRLLDLPAMRDWYAQALTETWRDDAHEDEVRGAGTILEDLRQATA
jgi:glutathione S-transferase